MAENAERVLAAQARSTFADMLRTVQQVVNLSAEDAEVWLQSQFDEVLTARKKSRGRRNG